MPEEKISLAYNDFYTCMNVIKDFINNSYSGVSGSPIEDPWETATSKTRTIFAQLNDEVPLVARFPKIAIGMIPPMSRERLTQGTGNYREMHTYNMALLYTCEKRAVWNHDSIKFMGENQCIKYLEYLGDKLKAYAGSFSEFNLLVLGDISNVRKSPDALKFTAFLPLKMEAHGRI